MMTLREYGVALAERAKQLKASRSEPPVIQRWVGSKESAEWTAWMAYWKAVGARATLEIVKDRQSWTVPNNFPWEFDIGYVG